jgi:hypothetical protein
MEAASSTRMGFIRFSYSTFVLFSGYALDCRLNVGNGFSHNEDLSYNEA